MLTNRIATLLSSIALLCSLTAAGVGIMVTHARQAPQDRTWVLQVEDDAPACWIGDDGKVHAGPLSWADMRERVICTAPLVVEGP